MLCGLLSVVVALPLLVGLAGPASALASAAAPKATGVTATAGDGSVLLSWDETSRNNFARDTAGWRYELKSGSGSYSEVTIPGSGPDTTSHLVTGLTNDVEYTFRVTSWIHSDGQTPGPDAPVSDEVTATPTAVADAPKLVSVKRYAQATGQLGVVNHFTLFPALIWRLEFDRWVSYVRPSDFALTGTTAKVDLWNDWDPSYQPSFTDQKTAIYVVAYGGDLATVTGEVTLSVASHHNIHNIGDNVNDIRNIRDDEKLFLSYNPVPTSGTNENTFALDPAETLVYFSQENFGVTEGDEAEVTVRLSRLRDEPTTISISATPLTATGSGVDYHGQTFTVTVPTWRASKTFKIRTTADTLTENDETFRLDINTHNLPTGVVRTTLPGSALDSAAYVKIHDGDNSGRQGTSQNDEMYSSALSADEEASPQAEESCVSGSLVADVQGYAGETWRGSPVHVERWERVLAAFGETGSYSANPMTAAEAQTYADRGWNRWVPVVAALECVETTPHEQPEAQPEAQPAQEPTPPPPAEPEITIAAGPDVTEGGDAEFTITATPAPASDLDVSVDVSQHGGYAATGSRTVTIGASGSTTFAVATTDDSVDEADGSVTATVSTGTGYTVSATGGDATVAVSDDDMPHISIAAGADVTEGADAAFTITADPAPHAALSVDVAITQTGDHGAAVGTRTVTIPATGSYTLAVATVDDSDDEADGSVTATVSTGSGYTVSATAGAATVAVSDDDDPPADDTPDTSDTDTSNGGTPNSGTAPSGPPTVTVSDATASEGAQELRFAVTLSHANPHDITFRYGGYGRTATLWQDWSIEFRRTFTLDAGETQVEIVVPIIDDDTPEDTETLRVYVYATSGIVIRSGFIYATGTITDND